jgi:hypothetical protein
VVESEIVCAIRFWMGAASAGAVREMRSEPATRLAKEKRKAGDIMAGDSSSKERASKECGGRE